jgi:hypothetical protein
VCVELKPKWGVLPSSPWVTHAVKRTHNRFVMQQRHKAKAAAAAGTPWRGSAFDPMDLRAGAPRRTSRNSGRVMVEVGFGKPPPRKQTQAAARLVLEVSAGWVSQSSRGLWGGDALLRRPVTGKGFGLSSWVGGASAISWL